MKSKTSPERFKGSEKIWVVRAGIRGEANHLFLSERLIVLRDPGMGTLKNIPKRREAFYQAYRTLKPDETPTGIAGIGGKFFRFIHEIAVGDLVLYPSVKDKQVHIGRITSGYRFSTTPDKNFPHQRSVVWFHSFPKSDLSMFAQRELGGARTFFRFKSHVEEIRTIVSAKKRKAPPKAKR